MGDERVVEPSLKAILESGKVRRLGGLQDTAATGREVCPLGVEPIDRRLGGLTVGATHEWLGPALEGGRGRAWLPPVTMLAWIAAQQSRRRQEADRGGLTVWVGRRTWASSWLTVQMAGVERSLFVDACRPEERIWAIDQALRCAGVASVVGDVTGLDIGAGRRLQLASEAGGTLGLLTRPAWERDVLSASMTRWMVSPVVGRRPGWRLKLSRARGMVTDGCTWEVWWDAARAVRVASGMVDRSGAPAPGAARHIA